MLLLQNRSSLATLKLHNIQVNGFIPTTTTTVSITRSTPRDCCPQSVSHKLCLPQIKSKYTRPPLVQLFLQQMRFLRPKTTNKHCFYSSEYFCTVRSLSNRPSKVPATGQLKVECSFNRRLYSLGSNRHLCIVLILIWIHHNARRLWRLEIKLPVAV